MTDCTNPYTNLVDEESEAFLDDTPLARLCTLEDVRAFARRLTAVILTCEAARRSVSAAALASPPAPPPASTPAPAPAPTPAPVPAAQALLPTGAFLSLEHVQRVDHLARVFAEAHGCPADYTIPFAWSIADVCARAFRDHEAAVNLDIDAVLRPLADLLSGVPVPVPTPTSAPPPPAPPPTPTPFYLQDIVERAVDVLSRARRHLQTLHNDVIRSADGRPDVDLKDLDALLRTILPTPTDASSDSRR